MRLKGSKVDTKANPGSSALLRQTEGQVDTSRYVTQSGWRSTINSLSSCHKCIVRDVCELTKTFTAEERNKGCNEVRNILIQLAGQYKRADLAIINRLAHLETMVRVQQCRDGTEQVTLSPEMKELILLQDKLMNTLVKFKKLQLEGRSKAKLINVTTIKDDEVFEFQ